MTTKDCKQCGKRFNKKVNTSIKNWLKSKYCSTSCCRLNTCFKKGLTPWSKSQKGIHLSKSSEFKKGMTPWNKGLKGYRAGVLNNKWKGGVTPEMAKIRKSKESIEWRKAVFTRDDFTCKDCGTRGAQLNAHHIKEFYLYPELRFDLSNGVTLCKSCHKARHAHANFGAKLTPHQVKRIRLIKEVSPSITLKNIASMFHVDDYTIGDVLRGATWSWVS